MENSSMKQNIKHIINTSVLFLTGIVLAGCSSSDAPIEQPINPTGKYVMTVNASKGSDATTRALTIGGSSGKKLIAYWDGTEKVTVKEGATTLGTLTTITPDATDNTKAKLSGTLDKAPSGTSLTLELCSPTYGSQDGTLAYIASNCDYATATTTVTYDDVNKTITGSDASFTNQQAIVKFTLQNAYGETLAVDKLTVSATGLKTSDTTTGDITITPTSATDVIYAALSGVSSTAVTLTATVGSDTYPPFTSPDVSFVNGQYYRVTVKMRPPIFYEPLTLVATQNDTGISFVNYSGGSIEYRINDGSWTSTTNFSEENISAGTKISFRGNNSKYYNGSPSNIQCNRPCYVYGNIMSLINATAFATANSLTDADTFRSLFQGNEKIDIHPSKDLLLPATTLTASCYHAMFFDCTSLTRAPVLPAPTLTDHCYHAMFSGCSSLAYIKCLATDIGATSCTTNWVNGVSTTGGTFVKASGMTDWTTGNNGIPSTSPPWTVTSE